MYKKSKSIHPIILYSSVLLLFLAGKSENAVAQHDFAKVAYYKVSESERGLTKQRNFGNVPDVRGYHYGRNTESR